MSFSCSVYGIGLFQLTIIRLHSKMVGYETDWNVGSVKAVKSALHLKVKQAVFLFLPLISILFTRRSTIFSNDFAVVGTMGPNGVGVESSMRLQLKEHQMLDKDFI